MRTKKGVRIFLAVELIAIAAMLSVLYLVMSRTDEGPKVVELELEKLEIHEEVFQQKEEGGTMHGYMNIALFGLDAVTESQLYKGSRSDVTMIASINLDTGDIKLVSVYRDTYLDLGMNSKGESVDYFWKCNAAYAFGGAGQAIKMLNMNLDMDITDFAAVSYKGLREVIDGLGGVYIDVDSEELKHINNYQNSIARILECDYVSVKETGRQLLDGIQAAAYCRIRQTRGDDFKRTMRQREVLKAIEERAKETDLATLVKVFQDCIGDVYTSIDSELILELLGNIGNYSIVEEAGFPPEDLRTAANIGAKGDCVIPVDLEANVVWLHRFLFGDEDYQASEGVKGYGRQIEDETSKYTRK